jgi:uncharacterized protein YoaH (UPF0181 family)
MMMNKMTVEEQMEAVETMGNTAAVADEMREMHEAE